MSKLTRSKLAYGVNVASHLIRQIRDYSPLLIFGGMGVKIPVDDGVPDDVRLSHTNHRDRDDQIKGAVLIS